LLCSLVNLWAARINQRSTLAVIRGAMNPDKPRNRSKFLLRLPKSVSDTAKQIASQEGVSQIIRVEQSCHRRLPI